MAMKKFRNFRLFASLAGMLASVLFVAVFTLEGRLRAGYDPQSMYISALSLGPRGWIQIVNFILLGSLLLLFTRGIASEFKGVKTAKAGIVLLMIIACLYMASGPFVMDPTGTPAFQSSVHGLLHGIFGGLVFLLMPITCFTFLPTFRHDPKWRSFAGWTLAFGLLLALATTFFTVSSKSPGLQIIFEGWFGLIQRTALVPFMIWVFFFALKMFRVSVQEN